MTIFHTIKWPISDFPSTSELEALPAEILLLAERELIGIVATGNRPQTIGMIIRIMLRQPVNRGHALRALTSIRKAIAEYEGPV